MKRLAWVLVALSSAACAGLNSDIKAKFDSATALVRTDDRNKFPEAERLLDEVIAANSQRDDAVYWKAQMLMAWSDALIEEAGYLAKAEAQLARSVERAEARVEKTETPEAREFAEVIATKIRALHDRVEQSLIRWRQEAAGLQARGVELIDTEIRGKENPPYQAHRVLADYYRIKGEHERALEELEAVRALNPDSAGLRFVRGVMQMKVEGDLDGAIRSMDEALALDGDFVKALYYKGIALSQKDDAAGAERVMKQVLEKSPGHHGAETFLETAKMVRQATEDLEAAPAD
jgi:tetratricopeptide (TPR) repeat protein